MWQCSSVPAIGGWALQQDTRLPHLHDLELEHLGCFQLVGQNFVAVEVQTVVAVVVVEEETVLAVVAVVETVLAVVAAAETVPEVVAQVVLVDPEVAFGLAVGQRV